MNVGTVARQQADARRLLVDLLHEAAALEHCLLDAYLFAACSIRTLPGEFATTDGGGGGGGGENRRRAVQFERVRSWKQTLLQVAQEEMLHLHYVQCLLRALGERPVFVLPDRDNNGNWIIPDWKAQVGLHPADGDKRGVVVPISPLDPVTIRRFVLYESTDALQDADPFGPAATSLYERLHDFELDLHLESMLLNVTDDARRAELKAQLATIYTTLTPLDTAAVAPAVAPSALAALHRDEVQFQSIADFYNQAVLPLYEEAFDHGWVVNHNRDLDNELQNPDYAAEGFLPVGPIYRDKNFEKAAQADAADPLRHYKNVRDVVREIVDEGEGAAEFARRAEALLTKVAEIGGARAYLQAMLADRESPAPTPSWLDDGQRLRLSHLYRFAMVMTEYWQEQDLAAASGVRFDPARTPVAVDDSAALRKLADELPAQFNACYLVLIAWLSRIYETQDWLSDQSRRYAIEMLASWPLMSIAIRPMLELAGFFPVDRTRLFRLDAGGQPVVPVLARELLDLYDGAERSEEIAAEMDHLAVRVLAGVAEWAAAQIDVVEDSAIPADDKATVLARLRLAAQLSEFEKQFPFRVAGGYSDRMPDLTYRQAHPDADRYEENPSTVAAIFDAGLVLRLRFGGWGRVQLATDPDPPIDEAGCTGTHMLHAADGDRRFDRALVWQLTDPGRTFAREPLDALPDLGVNCLDVSLLVAPGVATAGYLPLAVMQSAGAVQTSGLQQDCAVTGLTPVLSMSPAEILGDGRQLRIDLLTKHGVRPFLNGMNHVTSQDGEPIDPFVLEVAADAPTDGGAMLAEPLLVREVFNEGLTLLDMNPLQRLESSRQPCGFDGVSNIPAWAMAALTPRQQQLLADPAYPIAYLADRAAVLTDALSTAVRGDVHTQGDVDSIVSFAERLALVSVPRGTTVGWLTVLLHYGHTVSGPLQLGKGDDPVLSALTARTGLVLQPAEGTDRDTSNDRWLVTYTKGVMDTDALADFVYGELYVPLTVADAEAPIRLSNAWAFPPGVLDAVAGFACRFDAPFWASYQVDGDTRACRLADGTTVTETLTAHDDHSYRYTVSGYPGTADYECSFSADPSADGDGRTLLTWTVSFRGIDAGGVAGIVGAVASQASAMQQALLTAFSPTPI